MSDPNNQGDLAAAVDRLLAERLQTMNQGAVVTPAMQGANAAGGMPFNMPMMPGAMMQSATPSSIQARISVPLPDGRELSAYLTFPIPEQLANPSGIQQLAAMIAQTWPVQAYQPRQSGWGNGGGGGYSRGGRGGYGGGWNRGGRW